MTAVERARRGDWRTVVNNARAHTRLSAHPQNKHARAVPIEPNQAIAHTLANTHAKTPTLSLALPQVFLRRRRRRRPRRLDYEYGRIITEPVPSEHTLTCRNSAPATMSASQPSRVSSVERAKRLAVCQRLKRRRRRQRSGCKLYVRRPLRRRRRRLWSRTFSLTNAVGRKLCRTYHMLGIVQCAFRVCWFVYLDATVHADLFAYKVYWLLRTP